MKDVLLSIVTFLVGLDLYIVRLLDFIVEKRSNSSFADFASLGNSLLLFRIVPNNAVRFANNYVASDAFVKKLSIVTCLQRRVNGSTSLKTTNSPSGIDDDRVSSFSKYGKPFIIYLLLVSDASQNLIPNLSSLLGIYCRSVLYRSSTSPAPRDTSRVRFSVRIDNIAGQVRETRFVVIGVIYKDCDNIRTNLENLSRIELTSETCEMKLDENKKIRFVVITVIHENYDKFRMILENVSRLELTNDNDFDGRTYELSRNKNSTNSKKNW
ncbi:LOW QUALITY PROTEIN: hypothetical protein V1478_008426 [Vespula squamosa]|uniref:Uncharacterized protein n=1 Tax=Vespula squamosa TaxID=30214 RepID=A0ABD2ATK4_VESSQ